MGNYSVIPEYNTLSYKYGKLFFYLRIKYSKILYPRIKYSKILYPRIKYGQPFIS